MYLLSRLKNLLFSPEAEWAAIRDENLPNLQIYLKYLIWIAALPAIGYLLSFARFGDYLLNVRAAILSYVIALISIDATAYFSMLLAPSFTSRQEINRSLKLVAFAVAPVLVAGILIFIPVLGFVVIAIGAAYAAYLIYLGLPVILLTPEDKLVPFMITTLVIFAACYIVLAVVAGFIFGVGLVGLFVG